MLYVSIALFALAAVLGLTILLKWLSKTSASRTVVYAHGAFAVCGFLVLLFYAIQHPEHYPRISILLFAIAAVAGVYMFAGDLRKNIRPVPLALIHALVAVTGFVLLLLFVFA